MGWEESKTEPGGTWRNFCAFPEPPPLPPGLSWEERDATALLCHDLQGYGPFAVTWVSDDRMQCFLGELALEMTLNLDLGVGGGKSHGRGPAS